MNKPFTVEILKDLITQYDREEISLSRFKGILNEIAAKHSEQSGWVKCSDRLPTKEDADEKHRVEVWDFSYNKPSLETYWFVDKQFHSHWRKIVKPEN